MLADTHQHIAHTVTKNRGMEEQYHRQRGRQRSLPSVMT